MSPVTTVRILTGTLGAGAAGYGIWRLIDLGWANLVATLAWLAGGIVVHDAVIAPLVIALGLLGAGMLPRSARPAATGVLVVLGSITLAAVPVLGRFGATQDNPTLLDRPYAAGWAAFAALVLVTATTVATVSALRSRREGGDRRG